MPRARGSNATLKLAFETTYGTPPTDGYYTLPFVSSQLGEERPLIDSDLLGQGREMQDPIPDVATNDGDVVVPIDARNLWLWLKLMFGAPTITAVTGDAGFFDHVFVSGASDVPSATIEIGAPDAGIYARHFGAKANQLKISMKRSGQLNATMSMVCQGESDPANSSIDTTPTTLPTLRFAQATGSIKMDGSVVATIVSADLTMSNNLDKVEVISADGRIGGADPAMFAVTGSIVVKYTDSSFDTKATSRTPAAFTIQWVAGDHQLTISVPRTFLPRVKKPITGPAGIQATYNFSASGAGGHAATVTLRNDEATYA